MTEAPPSAPSFWLASLDESLEPRPSLEGDARVDVAIVGAGYTGLWTAYYLALAEPALRIAIVERQVAGFGAAGRNGGWCSAHLAGVDAWMQGARSEQAIALQRAMFDAVDEVGRVTASEGIDCDYAKSGFLNVATNAAQCAKAEPMLDELHRLGFSEHDFRWLDADACNRRVRVAGALGGFFSPHCAAVQPAKLARGLARAIERRGVSIYERSGARSISAGEVACAGGRLRAGVVLRCTEGSTASIPGHRRRLAPLHTMMIATEPLPSGAWKEIGCEDRMLFGDLRRILVYAQRTADDRIAIGSGGLYLYGSAVRDHFPAAGPEYEAAEAALREFFPSLADVRITHRWGGAFGVPRDMKAFVRFDQASGSGAAGGYVGNGVAAANLAGRTLADLVLGRETDRVHHPWVQHRTPEWEPEPLRWLGMNGLLRLGRMADRADRRGAPHRLLGAIFDASSRH